MQFDNENIKPDGNVVHVDLVHPVQCGNRDKVLTVTLRRPTLKDMIRASSEANGDDLKENMILIRLLGGLTREEMDSMDWGDDVVALLQALALSMGKSQTTGETESAR